jgi:exo-beta-1,3-glucanase (GH17 family)
MKRKALIVLAIVGVTAAMLWGANVASAEQFLGLAYGPFHHGEAYGTPITDAQFLSDLQTISNKLPQFTYLRTYDLNQAANLDRLVPVAWDNNYRQFKFAIGVAELNSNRAETQAQLDKAISLANTYGNVWGIYVGNECTPADTFNADRVSIDTLNTDLAYVKSKLTNANVKVTTGLSYGGAQAYGTQLLANCDVMTVHVYPFYSGPGTAGVDVYQAMPNLMDPAFGFPSFVSQFAPKEVILGETGWPSDPTGTPYGQSVPSAPNEYAYLTNLSITLSNAGYSGFYFEAFDEQWKTAEGPWGTHWGLLNADGSSKPFGAQGGPVPLPGTLLLMGSGLLGMLGGRRGLTGLMARQREE